MNKPNLFLIGAPKCGTTALANNLSKNRNIFLPENKEPRFFDRATFYDDEDDYITRNIDEYLSYYSNETAYISKYRMDASVFNMYDINSIKKILKLSPNSKFIVVLRDPVKASISMFNQRLSYSDPKMREVCSDFNKCWDLLELRKKGKGYPKGCRNKFLFRYDLLYSYEKYIPLLKNELSDKLFIGFYEEYRDNFDFFMQKLFLFLDIEYEKIDNKEYNRSFVLKNNLIVRGVDCISKKSFKIRKKLGLIGIAKYKNILIDRFKEKPKKIEASQKIYEFFKPTYNYINKLKVEIENQNTR